MRGDLDHLLEMWARWVRGGGNSRNWSASSLDFHGGSTGGASAPMDGLETMIEAAMVALRAKGNGGKLVALVISFEYGAITKPGLENAQQITKACALGMSLRTYYRKLREGKEHVKKYISQYK